VTPGKPLRPGLQTGARIGLPSSTGLRARLAKASALCCQGHTLRGRVERLLEHKIPSGVWGGPPVKADAGPETGLGVILRPGWPVIGGRSTVNQLALCRGETSQGYTLAWLVRRSRLGEPFPIKRESPVRSADLSRNPDRRIGCGLSTEKKEPEGVNLSGLCSRFICDRLAVP